MVKAIIVVPARMGASRFPGKMLAPLAGLPVVAYTTRAAKCVRGAAAVYVATDDDLIASAAQREGVQAIMTSPECRNGSERVAEAYEQLVKRGETADVVINLQGDAPLTPHWIVEDIIQAFTDPRVQVATPVVRCTAETLALFRADRARGMVGGTTAVLSQSGKALYFSKEVLPFNGQTEVMDVWHHVGLYAFRPAALLEYPNLPVGPIEVAEGLEQLRFLENDRPIQAVPVEGRGYPFWEVNNPPDIARIESLLAEKGDPNGL